MTEAKLPGKKPNGDYVIALHASLAAVPPAAWNALLAAQDEPSPFMRHEYLAALHDSQSACAATGWLPLVFTAHDGAGELQAACVCYLKSHSQGEYVFDWAWADAHARHGLDYYPKALLAVPFTPVPGSRLLARDAAARLALLRALTAWCDQQKLSSLHLLFGSAADHAAAREAGLMLRQAVQFHWHNDPGRPYSDFDDFLARLAHDKRKKIRQERRKVAQSGVRLLPLQGREITAADWDFFYRCYVHTYHAHGNPPYLTRDFFARLAATLPQAWLMFVAERDGQRVAASLIGLQSDGPDGQDHDDARDDTRDDGPPRVAYGRYWGALEEIDCLHFEACYYQPIAWCIAHGVQRFEGGAQGEHKMARALLPVATPSAHWLAHPAFADAVQHFLDRETAGLESYIDHLKQRTPFRQPDPGATSPAIRQTPARPSAGDDDTP
ncbi:MAG: GNAT family N-acetyltransferase [Comamonas sp.]